MDTPSSRYIGLSRMLKPQEHLLKTLPRHGSTPESHEEAEPKREKAKFKVPGDYDPPASSGAEDDDSVLENCHDKEPGLKSSPQSSSDTERPVRGNIKSTKFTSSSQTNGLPSRQTRNQTRKTGTKSSETKRPNESQPEATKRRRLSNTSDDNGGISSSTSVGRDSSILPTRSGGHLTTEYGFVRKGNTKSKYGGKPTYKKKTLSSQENKTEASDDRPRAKFQLPPDHDSPQKPKSAKFILLEDETISSPSRDKPIKCLNTRYHGGSDAEDDVLSSPKKNTAYKAPKLFLPQASPKPKRRPKQKSNPLRPNKREVTCEIKKPKAPSKSPSPPPAKFLIPAQVSDLKPRERSDNVGEDESLSDAASDMSSEESAPGNVEADEEAKSEAAEAATLCPWCNAPVDKELMHEYSGGKRLTARTHPRIQQNFCLAHKKRTAMETWKSKYPQVEWVGLEERFEKHRELLLGIINGKPSHYRNILASKIELGQARSTKQEANLNPGYYGPRGLNLMCDYFVEEFGDMLRENAVHDRVIAGRGSAAFIQSVLVAELGVRLISEDMGVSIESARGIMEESKLLGEMVHEET